jgi:hypothetical protein
MRKFKIGWAAFLALFFLGFSAWYGGNGKPITPEEGEQLIQQLRAFHGSSGSARRGFVDNIAEMIPRDDVNLENLKEGEAARISGETYGSIVMPQLFKRGGHPVFDSERVGLMLGEYGNEVDRVIVVRYRSLRDMIDMSMAPAMKEGRVYKYAALDHTEVFITRPTITFVHIRITLALLLLLIGWLGWRSLGWVFQRVKK